MNTEINKTECTAKKIFFFSIFILFSNIISINSGITMFT